MADYLTACLQTDGWRTGGLRTDGSVKDDSCSSMGCDSHLVVNHRETHHHHAKSLRLLGHHLVPLAQTPRERQPLRTK